ncbi:hypothetical protein EVAR_35745_1 [Eumeta japonica]|uniref:Uncharacterized protein n=1 Tax=Eumeta variegata TaxID=151549 RepID=A0A4C1VEL8_EUMVA|nr:hypothetical protein EVAR_35745_1 [Eumeta japonica]
MLIARAAAHVLRPRHCLIVIHKYLAVLCDHMHQHLRVYTCERPQRSPMSGVRVPNSSNVHSHTATARVAPPARAARPADFNINFPRPVTVSARPRAPWEAR